MATKGLDASDPGADNARAKMRVGDVLEGRFTLDARAGSGGMGEVFCARDRAAGQAVAVKVMLARHAGDHAHFERETRVPFELRHPAIVEFVAHGESPEGEPYLVLEWLEGEDLRARLARGSHRGACRRARSWGTRAARHGALVPRHVCGRRSVVRPAVGRGGAREP
ncbi:MAG TPA: protein kinase [Sorangium sp.]|nr:protein kinase [Sorangium sp.]